MLSEETDGSHGPSTKTMKAVEDDRQATIRPPDASYPGSERVSR